MVEIFWTFFLFFAMFFADCNIIVGTAGRVSSWLLHQEIPAQKGSTYRRHPPNTANIH